VAGGLLSVAGGLESPAGGLEAVTAGFVSAGGVESAMGGLESPAGGFESSGALGSVPQSAAAEELEALEEAESEAVPEPDGTAEALAATVGSPVAEALVTAVTVAITMGDCAPPGDMSTTVPAVSTMVVAPAGPREFACGNSLSRSPKPTIPASRTPRMATHT